MWSRIKKSAMSVRHRQTRNQRRLLVLHCQSVLTWPAPKLAVLHTSRPRRGRYSLLGLKWRKAPSLPYWLPPHSVKCLLKPGWLAWSRSCFEPAALPKTLQGPGSLASGCHWPSWRIQCRWWRPWARRMCLHWEPGSHMWRKRHALQSQFNQSQYWRLLLLRFAACACGRWSICQRIMWTHASWPDGKQRLARKRTWQDWLWARFGWSSRKWWSICPRCHIR